MEPGGMDATRALKQYIKPAAWKTAVSIALLAASAAGLFAGVTLSKRDYTGQALPFDPVAAEKGSYGYIDVCGVSDWVYRYESDTETDTYYAVEDRAGYLYTVELYQWQLDGMAAQQDYWNGDSAAPPAPYRLYGLVRGTGAGIRDSFSEVFGISAEDFDRYFGDMYLDATSTPGKEASWAWYLVALFGFLFSMLLLALILPQSRNQRKCLARLAELGELERAAHALEAADPIGQDRARVSGDYLFCRGTGVAVRWDDIVWAYTRVIGQSADSLVLCTEGLKNVQAIHFGPGVGGWATEQILALLSEQNPGARIGYTQENIGQYDAARGAGGGSRRVQTQQQLTQAYRAGRTNLLIMAVLTAVNTALALTGSTRTFLFAAFFPYICASWAKHGYLGLSEGAAILLGCALPIVLWLACWLLSDKQRYGYLKAAAALFALDTVYMAYFFVTYGFEAAFIITVLFHALILWQLIRASVAAKRLAAGDFSEPPAVPEHAYGGTPAPDEAELGAAPVPSVFQYDHAYARQTGARKAGRIALTCVVFFAWMLGGAFLSIWLFEMRLGLGFGVAIPAAVVVCLTAIAWFIVAMVRLSAFLEAPVATYRVDGAGTLARDKMDLPPFNHTVFRDLELIEERDDSWVVGYESPSGRRKKAVIPKAYPGLEAYMAGQIPKPHTGI